MAEFPKLEIFSRGGLWSNFGNSANNKENFDIIFLKIMIILCAQNLEIIFIFIFIIRLIFNNVNMLKLSFYNGKRGLKHGK